MQCIEKNRGDCSNMAELETNISNKKTVLKNDEVISTIIIPKRAKSLKLACHKISKRFEDDISTVLRTFVEHISIQISRNLKPVSKVLFTGGGVFNTFLMQRIQQLSKIELEETSEEIIDYKEALIFAFLGLLKDRNEINCLKSVTGAEKNHSSGKIYTSQILN